jgi:hypothetical protein
MAALLMVAVAGAPDAAAASGRVALDGHVAPALRSALRDGRATIVGAARSRPVRLTFTLRRERAAALERRRRGHATRQLTSRAVTARYGPSGARRRSVIRWLRDAGMSAVRGSADHLLVTATASPDQIRRALGIRLVRVRSRRSPAATSSAAPARGT